MNFRVSRSEPSENDSFIAVHEDSAFDMQADGAGEDNFFQIATLANEILDLIAVGDADNVLLNDGAVVEHFGDVVAGGADQLYTAFERLMIGAGAHERGQE